MIDATIRCDVDQIEKMIPVMIDVPTQASPRQRTKIEVPQITHYRFHERFRWPIEQVLLVGMGMVALPIPVDGAPLVPGMPLPIGSTPARADLLIFVESKGATAPAAAAAAGNVPQPALDAARRPKLPRAVLVIIRRETACPGPLSLWERVRVRAVLARQRFPFVPLYAGELPSLQY